MSLIVQTQQLVSGDKIPFVARDFCASQCAESTNGSSLFCAFYLWLDDFWRYKWRIYGLYSNKNVAQPVISACGRTGLLFVSNLAILNLNRRNSAGAGFPRGSQQERVTNGLHANESHRSKSL